MKKTIDLLTLATNHFPPPTGVHHSLMIMKGKFVLTVFVTNDRWKSVVFDDDDLIKPIDILWKECYDVLKRMKDTNE
jgi:hypothetical protein